MTEPILSVRLQERDLDVVRSVYPMQLDRESLRIFWEKSGKYHTLFNKELKADFNRFLSIFVSETPDGGLEGKGLLWRIDDFVGVFYLTDIDPEGDALCHFTFFDGRIHGRDVLAKALLKYAFDKYRFRRLSVQLPMYVVPAALHFVERIGFKREGRKRKSTLFNGEWFDTMQYGILSSEVTNAV